MSNYLSLEEIAYIENTISYQFPLWVQLENTQGISVCPVSINMDGGIPVSNYAPLSFQTIILFYALDILQTRSEIRNGKAFNPNSNFKKRLDALPMDNQTRIIFKFCYAIMREIRNKFVHSTLNDNSGEVRIESATIPVQAIKYLFAIVIKYIELIDENKSEFNKYDEIVIKELVKQVFNQIKFDSANDAFVKLLDCIFKKLKFDIDFRYLPRFRYICRYENWKEFREKFNRKPNREILQDGYSFEHKDVDEYLIIIGNEKYLILGSCLDKYLMENDFSE